MEQSKDNSPKIKNIITIVSIFIISIISLLTLFILFILGSTALSGNTFAAAIFVIIIAMILAGIKLYYSFKNKSKKLNKIMCTIILLIDALLLYLIFPMFMTHTFGGARIRIFQYNNHHIIESILLYKEQEGYYPKNISDIEDSSYDINLNTPKDATYELFIDENGTLTFCSNFKEDIFTQHTYKIIFEENGNYKIITD